MRLIWILAVVLAAGAVAQTPEAMLGAALHQERVSGNLQAAIDGYRKVLAAKGVSRTVAAQAQYHIGICYEKLGDQEARKAFESVVKNYGDQRDYVTQARARLAALNTGGGPSSSPRTRLVWDDAIDFWGRVSADGRYLSHVDWATGDLAIRDLQNNTSRRITNYGGFEKALGEVESTTISPDGKRIVFSWDSWAPSAKESGNYELRVIQADGSGERILKNPAKGMYFEAQGWSPDGKWVAMSEQRQTSPSDRTSKLVLISVDSGERKEIATQGKNSKTEICFSPDGNWIAYSEGAAVASSLRSVFIVSARGSNPESQAAEGATFMGWTPKGDGILLDRPENGRNQLFLQPVSLGRATGEAKALHLPGTQGSPLGITPQGELFYGTMNRKVEVSVHKLDPSQGLIPKAMWKTESSQLSFANNMGNIRFSPDGKKLATLNSNRSIRVQEPGQGFERVLTLETEVRRFEWMPDGRGFIVSAIQKDGKDVFVRVDLENGGSTTLCAISEVEPGRVFMPAADGKSVYQLKSKGLQLMNLSDCSNRTLTPIEATSQGPLNLRLSKDGKQLLVTSFAHIDIYDIASGSFRPIYKRAGEMGDNIWGADWSADGTSVLAVARLRQAKAPGRELRIYPVRGGEPKRQPIDGVVRDFATSANGEQVAIANELGRSQVWVIENFLPAP